MNYKQQPSQTGIGTKLALIAVGGIFGIQFSLVKLELPSLDSLFQQQPSNQPVIQVAPYRAPSSSQQNVRYYVVENECQPTYRYRSSKQIQSRQSHNGCWGN